jgi:hypothetical protein
MTIARRLPGGCAERNLKTGCGIRMGGRDIVPLDDCDMLSTPEFQGKLNSYDGVCREKPTGRQYLKKGKCFEESSCFDLC